MQLLARMKRYLANRYLADPDRDERLSSNQRVARSNAAEASVTLRKLRTDREGVEADLKAWREDRATESGSSDPAGEGTELAL